jgi:hypothetical protein
MGSEMSALEIIGIIALVIWIPTGVVITTLIAFERVVSPATFGRFLRWYWRDRTIEDQKP